MERCSRRYYGRERDFFHFGLVWLSPVPSVVASVDYALDLGWIIDFLHFVCCTRRCSTHLALDFDCFRYRGARLLPIALFALQISSTTHLHFFPNMRMRCRALHGDTFEYDFFHATFAIVALHALWRRYIYRRLLQWSLRHAWCATLGALRRHVGAWRTRSVNFLSHPPISRRRVLENECRRRTSSTTKSICSSTRRRTQRYQGTVIEAEKAKKKGKKRKSEKRETDEDTASWQYYNQRGAFL